MRTSLVLLLLVTKLLDIFDLCRIKLFEGTARAQQSRLYIQAHKRVYKKRREKSLHKLEIVNLIAHLFTFSFH